MSFHCESFAKWLRDQNIGEEIKSPAASSSAGTSLGISSKLIGIARTEIERMLKLPNNIEPDRGNLDDPSIKWRNGKPNYTLANLAFLKGKCMAHEKGSLETVVQNAVKTWEMEASHKVDTNQWETIVHDEYRVKANNGKTFFLEEASKEGNYNVLMDDMDPNIYDSKSESFESSHHLFQQAFESSFPWEVLQVFAGPPEIAFSWRHWGEFTGEYKGNKGEGQLIEMTGFALVTVTEALKITGIRIFFRPEKFIQALKGLREEHDKDELEKVQQMVDNILEVHNIELNGKVVGNTDQLMLPWEVTEILSDEPEISFKWAHGTADGPFSTVNGFAVIKVNEGSFIKRLKAFYKAA